MDRQAVTQTIRERMAAGILPRVIPPLTAPGRPTAPTGHINADTAIGVVTCAACDTRGAQVDYRFPDGRDRKSTRLNSSHGSISYAVFCLKKKTKNTTERRRRLPSIDIL